MLCVCKCSREPTDQVIFDVEKKGKYCQKCGMKFKLIERPIIGIMVKAEGDCWDSLGRWVTLENLKELLK